MPVGYEAIGEAVRRRLYTAKGSILAGKSRNNPVPLLVGADGQILYADSTQPSGVKWAAAPTGTSPLTTKGDLWGRSSVDARIPVGANGQVLMADSAQTLGVKWATPAGSGASVPSVVQVKAGSAQITTLTLDLVPASGHALLLFLDILSGTATAVASTNTTWTKIKTFVSGGAATYDLWVGIVAGVGGTLITITRPGTYCSGLVLEVTDVLTPTLGANVSGSSAANGGQSLACTSGRLVFIGVGQDNTTNFQSIYSPTMLTNGLPYGIVAGVVGYVPATLNVYEQLGGGAVGGMLIAEIT